MHKMTRANVVFAGGIVRAIERFRQYAMRCYTTCNNARSFNICAQQKQIVVIQLGEAVLKFGGVKKSGWCGQANSIGRE